MTQLEKVINDIRSDKHFQKHYAYILGRIEVALLAHQQDKTNAKREDGIDPAQHFEEIGRFVDSTTKLGDVLRRLESQGGGRQRRERPQLHDQHFKTTLPKQDPTTE